jgi:pimeloyl-ACP methyl ester carboxylesterase
MGHPCASLREGEDCHHERSEGSDFCDSEGQQIPRFARDDNLLEPAAFGWKKMSNTPEPFSLPPLPSLLSVNIFGTTIRYYDVGSGSPLILVHGIGGDADDWAFCLDPLAATHRVIALDLPGFGRSSKPHIQYTIAGWVEMLDRFLQALNIERAALVGHSLGGWIAASYTLQLSQRVTKLILLDAAGVWGNMTGLPVDLHVSTLAHMREIFQFLFYDKRLASDSLIELAYSQHLERDDGYTIHSILQNTRDGRERLDDRISALSVPTLILWGENDEMIPLALGRRIHELVPGSTLAVIPQCGHLPNLEKPAELVGHVLKFVG